MEGGENQLGRLVLFVGDNELYVYRVFSTNGFAEFL